MLRWIANAVAAMALCGCVSAYAPSSISGGFDQRQVSEVVWRISYFGNAYTSVETVQTYWLYRCAEITLEQGYNGFQILSNVELTQSPSAIPALFQQGDGARVIPIVESGLDGKPYMVANIMLLRAPLPDRPRVVFDANVLKTFLQPYVTGELCGGNVCPHVHRYLFPGFVSPEGNS
jgi:hypothetical protein